MLTIGKVCVKTAGRDAGQMAVIIDVLDKNLVMIDGQVRRRKCNIAHLEPTSKSVEVKKNASHEDVVHALKALEIAVVDRKPKAKSTNQKKPVARSYVASKAPAKRAAAKAKVAEDKTAARKAGVKSAKPAVAKAKK